MTAPTTSPHAPPAPLFPQYAQAGVLQYVVLKLVLTPISFMLEAVGRFGEGDRSVASPLKLAPSSPHARRKAWHLGPLPPCVLVCTTYP